MRQLNGHGALLCQHTAERKRLKRKMPFCFIFLWLLPLTASSAVTSGLTHNLTNVTQTRLYQHQQTTQQTPVLGRRTTLSTIADVPPQVDTTPTMAPISNSSHGPNSSTGTTTSEAMLTPTSPTTEASSPTRPSTVPPMVSSYSRSTGTTSTSGVSRDGTNSPSSPRMLTLLMSTASIEPVGKTASTPAWSSTTTGKARIDITMAKKRHDSKSGDSHSKIVAGLIGGALLLMMVGFLVIYIQKKKFQKQQITSTDWAGPSPFLSGGENNGQVTLRSSNRISLSSFLPQRLSKRLSLLPEMVEELQDMTQSTTFEGKHQGDMLGRGVDGTEPQDKKESSAVSRENGISKTNDVLQINKSEAAISPQAGCVQPSNPPAGEESAPGSGR